MTASVARRHHAAVDPADQAHPLEGGEVAAHRLGGDVVLSASTVTDSRPRWAPGCAIACWRSSAYIVIASSSRSCGRICVYVVLRPNVLTVKGVRGLTCDHERTSPTSPPTSLLHGTPVVPGVAYGPALVARASSPDAIAAFDGGVPDEEAALAAYDDAVGAVADGFERKAEGASGAAAEVLTASAGLARDKGLRGAVRKQLAPGRTCSPRCTPAVDQFVAVFTQMGGLMAERVTDLRDIERRVVAHLVGEPEPGVPTPRSPRCSWPRTSRPPTPRRSTPRSSSRW